MSQSPFAAHSPNGSPFGKYQSLPSGYQNAPFSFAPQLVPTLDQRGYPGAGFVVKFFFLLLKFYQSYICTEILQDVGGDYAVRGELYWYIPLIVYAYTFTQVLGIVFALFHVSGTLLHRYGLAESLGAVNTVCNAALINCLHDFGATGDIIDTLRYLIHIQLTLFTLACGFTLAFTPLPDSLKRLLDTIEDYIMWLWSTIFYPITEFFGWGWETISLYLQPCVSACPLPANSSTPINCGGLELGTLDSCMSCVTCGSVNACECGSFISCCMNFRKITSVVVQYSTTEESVKHIELNYDADPLTQTFGSVPFGRANTRVEEKQLGPGELITNVWCVRAHEILKGFGFSTNLGNCFSVGHDGLASTPRGSTKTPAPIYKRYEFKAGEGQALIGLRFDVQTLNLTHIVFQKNETGELVDQVLPRIPPPAATAAPVAPKSKGCCGP